MLSYSRHKPEVTPLFQIIYPHYASFLEKTNHDGKRLPEFAQKEVKAYLTCGMLWQGFSKLKCSDCGNEKLLAFSCKKRGFCPSCAGRRMEETTEHLLSNVIAPLPIRQYVISFPVILRYWLARNPALLNCIHQLVIKEISCYLKLRSTKELGIEKAETGSVSFIQRVGSSLNLNYHFHILFIEGVYEEQSDGQGPIFHKLGPPTDAEIKNLVKNICRHTCDLLLALGYLAQNESQESGVDNEELSLIDLILSASAQNKISVGERSGKDVRRIRYEAWHRDYLPVLESALCASFNGFSVHANTFVKAKHREQLRRLIRYVARPPVSNERISINDNGEVIYKLKTIFRDGTKAVLFSVDEFIEKIIGIIPLPFVNLVRYSGVFGPNHRLRSQIVPRAQEPPDKSALAIPPNRAGNIAWAELLKRSFGLDVLNCERCGGRFKLISVTKDREDIGKILRGMGLSAQPPPIQANRQEVCYGELLS